MIAKHTAMDWRKQVGIINFLFETVYFKPYACCRWTHAAVDVAIRLRSEFRRQPLDKIDIFTFRRAVELKSDLPPQSMLDAQFNLPFVFAVAYCYGPDALLPFQDTFLSDQSVLEVAAKISVHIDPKLDSHFPGRAAARVRAVADKTIREAQVDSPRGDPVNPLSTTEVIEKIRRLNKSGADNQYVYTNWRTC